MTLDQLIQKRLAELEMKRSELARGMGYAQDKLGKGCTRIDRIREAKWSIYRFVHTINA